MEPLTTLALVAAFLAPVPLTRRPDMVAGIIGNGHTIFAQGDTNVLVSPNSVFTESLVLELTSIQSMVDRKDLLLSDVLNYQALSEGWDGEGSARAHQASAAAAVMFVDALPSGLPFPRPMMSTAGEIGFYWDLERGFADISFDRDGLASFFSRTRVGVEHYSERLPLETFSRQWFFDSLGEMAAPIPVAA